MLLRNLSVSFASAVASLIVLGGAATPALAVPVKNIVLVHGAWVDGKGWKPVYEVLTKDRYKESHPKEVAAVIEEAAQKSQDCSAGRTRSPRIRTALTTIFLSWTKSGPGRSSM